MFKSLRSLVLISLLLLPVVSGAQILTDDKATYRPLDEGDEEAILYYWSDVSVNADNSIDVQETIIYDGGDTPRHGIIREIDTRSADNRHLKVSNVSVINENEQPYQVKETRDGDYVNLRIGDPGQTFVGEKQYFISYHVDRAVTQLKDFDEIYWNVIGQEWRIPIYKAYASITFSTDATIKQSACYRGEYGSNSKCDLEYIDDPQEGWHGYDAGPFELAPYTGVTMAVGFEKGFVAPYTAQEQFFDHWQKYTSWFVGILIALLTFVILFTRWGKYGRDARGSGTIVPEYEAPDNLTPYEVGAIGREYIRYQEITSEIIHLATQGFLKIKQIPNPINIPILNILTQDYELTKLKSWSDLPNEFDKEILESLFDGKDKVLTSELKDKFYIHISRILDLVESSLKSKGYYSNTKGLSNPRGGIFQSVVVLLFFLGFGAVFAGFFSLAIFGLENFLPAVIGVLLAQIFFFVFSFLTPAKSEKGALTKEKILGLKKYLSVAEKDRMEFANAPERTPELFEKLLPYAMALGVVDVFAQSFKGIYVKQPTWYEGVDSHTFDSAVFAHSLTTFASSTSHYATSSPSRSSSGGGGGSSGGGSSGGGGGGGGGGSW